MNNRRLAIKLHREGQRLLVLPVTDASIDEAKSKFEKSFLADSTYGRALGWFAYAEITAFIEGIETREVLAAAHEYAELSVKIEPDDGDNQWALGLANLYTGRFDRVEPCYESALELDQDGNIDLLSDYGHTLLHLGRNELALQYCERSRRHHDWHRWNEAWCEFFLAQREPQRFARDRIGRAVAIIDGSYMKPHQHPRYLAGMQLLKAACYESVHATGQSAMAIDVFRELVPWGYTMEQELAVSPFNLSNDAARANCDAWEHWAGKALAR